MLLDFVSRLIKLARVWMVCFSFFTLYIYGTLYKNWIDAKNVFGLSHLILTQSYSLTDAVHRLHIETSYI